MEDVELNRELIIPDIWRCTKCQWIGIKQQAMRVMYHGIIDWRNCPSCNSVAIPSKGEKHVS